MRTPSSGRVLVNTGVRWGEADLVEYDCGSVAWKRSGKRVVAYRTTPPEPHLVRWADGTEQWIAEDSIEALMIAGGWRWMRPLRKKRSGRFDQLDLFSD